MFDPIYTYERFPLHSFPKASESICSRAWGKVVSLWNRLTAPILKKIHDVANFVFLLFKRPQQVETTLNDHEISEFPEVPENQKIAINLGFQALHQQSTPPITPDTCHPISEESVGETAAHTIKDPTFFKHGSYVDTLLMGLLPRSGIPEKNEEFIYFFQQVAYQVTHDWLLRTLTNLSCGSVKSISAGTPLAPYVVNLLQPGFCRYLQRCTPEQIQSLVQENKKSLIVQKLQEIYPTQVNGQSILPISVLEAIFKKEFDKADKKVKSQLQQVINGTHIPKALIDQLARKSGCSPSEIEPLFRIRFIRLMLILGQATTAPLITPLAVFLGLNQLRPVFNEAQDIIVDEAMDAVSIKMYASIRQMSNHEDLCEVEIELKVNSISTPGSDYRFDAVKNVRFLPAASKIDRDTIHAFLSPQSHVEMLATLAEEAADLSRLDRSLDLELSDQQDLVKADAIAKRVDQGNKALNVLKQERYLDDEAYQKGKQAFYKILNDLERFHRQVVADTMAVSCEESEAAVTATDILGQTLKLIRQDSNEWTTTF